MKCPRCQGRLIRDEDSDLRCINCSHTLYARRPEPVGWTSTAVKRGPQAGMRL